MIYIDLFSGIGGFALGAYWSGIRFDKHYFSEVELMQSNSTDNDSPKLFHSETSRKSSGKNFPTPQARDWKGSSGRSLKGQEIDLPTAVKMDLSSPEVSPARISVSPAKGSVSQGHGRVFGLKCLSQLGYYDPDLSLLRTLEQSLFEDSTPCLERLPRSGTMLNGKIYAQATWVRRTDGNVSGLWLTPATVNIEGGEDRVSKRTAYRKSVGRHYAPGCLAEQVKWPTPRAGDPGSRKPGTGGAVLREEVKKWPTPRACEYKGVGPLGSKSQKHMNDRKYLCAVVQEADQASGSLNPQWVDWLMGYPVGWTDLKGSEMQLSLK